MQAMPSHIAPELELWLGLLLTLCGVAVIVALTAAAERCIGSVVWRRTLGKLPRSGCLPGAV